MEKIYTGITTLIVETDDIEHLSQSVCKDLSNGDIVIKLEIDNHEEVVKKSYVVVDKKEDSFVLVYTNSLKVDEIGYFFDENEGGWYCDYSGATDIEKVPHKYDVDDIYEIDDDTCDLLNAGDVVQYYDEGMICYIVYEKDNEYIYLGNIFGDNIAQIVYAKNEEGWHYNEDDSIEVDLRSLEPQEQKDVYLYTHTMTITGRNDDDSADVSIKLEITSFEAINMSGGGNSIDDAYGNVNEGYISARVMLGDNAYSDLLSIGLDDCVSFGYLQGSQIRIVEIYDGADDDAISIVDNVVATPLDIANANS